MSATSQASSAASTDVGSIAHVNFRVRCEKLGYGEEVFLVQEDDTEMRKVRIFVHSFAMLHLSSIGTRSVESFFSCFLTDLPFLIAADTQTIIMSIR